MNNKKDIIMSLDISTSCIGITILENDGSEFGKIIEMTHVNPKVSNKIKGIESLFIKKRIFKEEFLEKWKNFGITKVVIEAPLLTSNNSETCATLLRFNGMISDCIYETLNIVPNYISSYDARKYSFPDLLSIRKYTIKGELVSKDKIISNLKKSKLVLFGSHSWDVDKKTVIQSKVAEIFPEIQWLYDDNGELKKENFDASDSYVAALGFINKQRYGELKPIVTSYIINDNEITYTSKYWDKIIDKKIYI